MPEENDIPFQLFASTRGKRVFAQNNQNKSGDAAGADQREMPNPEKLDQDKVFSEVDMVHGIIRVSPLLEKLLAHSIASVNNRITELEVRVKDTEEHTQDRLTDRFGEGNEWRGLADDHLLAIHACIKKLEMKIETDKQK